MKEKLIELLMSAEINAEEQGFFNCHRSKVKAECIADYLLANGVIPLPCKVGDTVYIIRSRTGNEKNLYIVTDRVKRIVTEKATDVNWLFTRIEYENITSSFEWDFSNIFLIREEAEKALKEREHDIKM